MLFVANLERSLLNPINLACFRPYRAAWYVNLVK